MCCSQTAGLEGVTGITVMVTLWYAQGLDCIKLMVSLSCKSESELGKWTLRYHLAFVCVKVYWYVYRYVPQILLLPHTPLTLTHLQFSIINGEGCPKCVLIWQIDIHSSADTGFMEAVHGYMSKQQQDNEYIPLRVGEIGVLPPWCILWFSFVDMFSFSLCPSYATLLHAYTVYILYIWRHWNI